VRPEGAGLGHHAERSGTFGPFLEIGAEGRGVASAQVEDTEAIRAAEPHTAIPRDLGEAILHLPAFLAGLGKTRRKHDDRANTLGDRCLERGGREGRRHRDQRELDRPGTEARSG